MALRTRPMNTREARRFLYQFAAALLISAGDSADPLCDRYSEHVDARNAEREMALLQAQIPHVARVLRRLGGQR